MSKIFSNYKSSDTPYVMVDTNNYRKMVMATAFDGVEAVAVVLSDTDARALAAGLVAAGYGPRAVAAAPSDLPALCHCGKTPADCAIATDCPCLNQQTGGHDKDAEREADQEKRLELLEKDTDRLRAALDDHRNMLASGINQALDRIKSLEVRLTSAAAELKG